MPTVLEAADARVAELIAAEQARQHDTLCLIPSENHVSPAVLAATGSVLTNKYSEGYPSRRYYQGNAGRRRVEALAAERAQALFGVEHANVQPLSGAPANLAVYAAFLEPGDTVLGMSLDAGGHLTHGWGVSVTGRWFRAVRYGVRRDTGVVDLDEVRELALRERPKLIWCGGTAIPRTIDFAGFAAIAEEVGAVLAADVAHIAGLIAGGAHPSPAAARRRHLDHDPQDAARPARRDAHVTATSTRARSTAPSSPACRAARTTTRRPRSPSRCTRPRSRRSPTTPARSSPTPSALARRADRARLRPRLGRHRQPPAARRPHRPGRRRPGRRGGARAGGARLQLQRRPVRSAPAAGPVGHPARARPRSPPAA